MFRVVGRSWRALFGLFWESGTRTAMAGVVVRERVERARGSKESARVSLTASAWCWGFGGMVKPLLGVGRQV